MSEINSPLGRKQFATSQRKTFTVSDESFDDFEIPEKLSKEESVKVREQVQALKQNTKRVNPESKSRIELLIGLGRKVKEVEIDEYTFSLRTLKAREIKEVVKELTRLSNSPDFVFETRIQVLSRSLYQINGHDVGQILGGSEVEDVSNFLNECDDNLVVRLYEAYTELTKDVNLKEEEVKQVADDIKK
jgi:hypothetical protein